MKTDHSAREVRKRDGSPRCSSREHCWGSIDMNDVNDMNDADERRRRRSRYAVDDGRDDGHERVVFFGHAGFESVKLFSFC
jgi:hypothetical protein